MGPQAHQAMLPMKDSTGSRLLCLGQLIVECASVSTTISQIGKRQAFAVAEGRFFLSDGSTFNVIKKRVCMSDYNSGFTGDRVVELLNMIHNLAKADLSNAMTVSLGQNGYAKFNNGLLIQWGYKAASSSGTNITYTSISFYNAAYVPVITYYEPGNGIEYCHRSYYK